MKIGYLVIFTLITISSCGQNKKIPVCEIETVEMTLAYEFDGQCAIDDMVFKSPELVEYKSEKINSKNYTKGVYQFYSMNIDKKRLKDCKINIDYKTIAEFENPFHESTTKIISIKNKAFAGTGTTMDGNEKLEWEYHEFKYKIFKVKFEKVYIGMENRTIVNIDRKSKTEKEILGIECPIYIMTNIIDIQKV